MSISPRNVAGGGRLLQCASLLLDDLRQRNLTTLQADAAGLKARHVEMSLMDVEEIAAALADVPGVVGVAFVAERAVDAGSASCPRSR